jgi:hypothetical protein
MSFEQTASRVISEYIQSGICIDNDYAPPYPKDDEEKKKDSTIPQKLYYSFREKGKCDLDIYCYKNKADWQKAKDYAFNSKDLLVLDWELTDVDPKFEDALDILSAAVDSETIQFVIIYTRVQDLTDVELNILSYFGPHFADSSVVKLKRQQILDYISSKKEITNPETFIEKLKVSLNEIAIAKNTENIKSIKKSFITSIQGLYEGHEKNAYQILGDILNESATNLELKNNDVNLFLGPFLNNKITNTTRDQSYNIYKFDTEKLFYSINNTVVMIFRNEKDADGTTDYIEATDVFDEFAKVIYKNPHSFITLLSLEMKGIYRSKISVLGKEMLRINEKAFFYQMDNYDSNEEFYNFLINSWNNEINNFSREHLPQLLETIDEYRTNNNLSNIDITKHHNELVKMGFLLSCSTEKIRENKIIKFGDIFKWVETGTGQEYFFLNITPHCDCLRPDKIKNNFHFIISKKDSPNIQTALRGAEREHYTFISIDKPVVIDWETKPFTMYVSKNIIINNEVKTNYLGEEIKLVYFTTLKENFTQRLANHSFGYTMRVGIDHPHLKV